MQVPEALSRQPHTQTELEGLLRVCNTHRYNTNHIKITMTTDKGPTKVCFNLEAPKVLDLSKFDIKSLEYENNPDFWEIVQTLKEGDPKAIQQLPSLQLYLWENGTL